jgi:hypothetical protein
MNKFLKVGNALLGIIGIASGAFFYYDGLKEREPTFIVDPIVSTIVDKELVKDKPLKILNSKGIEITQDVNVLTFYFFNQGNESIRQENILSDLTLSLPINCEILDYKILKVSRDVSKIRLLKNDSIKNSISINFKILEKSDGFTGQIIYLGGKENRLALRGEIEGVKQVFTNVKTFNSFKLSSPLILILILFLIFNLYFIFKFNPRLKHTYQLVIRNEKNIAEKTSFSFTYAKFLIVCASCFVLVLIGSLFLSKILLSKWLDPKYKPNIKTEIPVEILP